MHGVKPTCVRYVLFRCLHYVRTQVRIDSVHKCTTTSQTARQTERDRQTKRDRQTERERESMCVLTIMHHAVSYCVVFAEELLWISRQSEDEDGKHQGSGCVHNAQIRFRFFNTTKALYYEIYQHR